MRPEYSRSNESVADRRKGGGKALPRWPIVPSMRPLYDPKMPCALSSMTYRPCRFAMAMMESISHANPELVADSYLINLRLALN